MPCTELLIGPPAPTLPHPLIGFNKSVDTPSAFGRGKSRGNEKPLLSFERASQGTARRALMRRSAQGNLRLVGGLPHRACAPVRSLLSPRVYGYPVWSKGRHSTHTGPTFYTLYHAKTQSLCHHKAIWLIATPYMHGGEGPCTHARTGRTPFPLGSDVNLYLVRTTSWGDH